MARVEVCRGIMGRRKKFANEWSGKTDVKKTNVGRDMTELGKCRGVVLSLLPK